jgi:hypothetical protein
MVRMRILLIILGLINENTFDNFRLDLCVKPL